MTPLSPTGTTARLERGRAYAWPSCPLWDVARRRLLWVDAAGGSVFEGTLDHGRVEVTREHAFDGTVGGVAVADNGVLLVAAQEHLVVVRPDGSRSDGPRIVPVGHPRRLGGGATDPAGRFLVGTRCLSGVGEGEVLVRLEKDGWLTLIDADLALPDGLGWSGDGRAMYSVDAHRRTVFVRDYDPGTGAVGERRVHLRTGGALPTGLAVDAEDHLWIGFPGAGCVRRFAPDGALAGRVDVPVSHTSGVAFGGDDLRTLVVTAAGRLVTARVDVPGLLAPAWSGASL